MFQRLKGAIDSRIAEEQARSKALAVPARTASTSRRTVSSRNESPTVRSRAKPRVVDDGLRGPDPSEFEAAFVIEDDSEEPSRVGTPAPADARTENMEEKTMNESTGVAAELEAANEKAEDSPLKLPTTSELPAEVRAKLRKLEKLESRYQELLRSYRIAHARAVAIEPFEKALKENTPLTSISEPGALVEYINQLNLRGDMVMDELKRVTTDRDEYKKKFEQSEKEKISACEELETSKKSAHDKPAEVDHDVPSPLLNQDLGSKSPPTIKSPVSTVLGIFSPKQKAQNVEEIQDSGESFFSYDEEVPKLQFDLEAKTAEIVELRAEVKTLQSSLGAAKATNETLSESLQSLEKQLSESRDLDKEEELKSEIRNVQEKLDTTTGALRDLEAQINHQEKISKDSTAAKDAVSKELVILREESETQLKALRSSQVADAAKIKELMEEIDSLTASKTSDGIKLKDLQSQLVSLDSKVKSVESEKAEIQTVMKSIESKATELETPPIVVSTTPSLTATGAKKKNKKKKKGSPAANSNDAAKAEEIEDVPDHSSADSVATEALLAQIVKLQEDIAARDVQIEKLLSKRKTEEELREHIETMEESLIDIGQMNTESKEKIKGLLAEKMALENNVRTLEQEIKSQQNKSELSAKTGNDLEILSTQYKELKVKSAALQSELGAAQQLATSRYKDLTDLREVLQKAQPELKSLRSENALLKSVKDDLATRTAELRRLETREKDLKSDMASFKKQAADRESEIKALNDKLTQETNGRLKAEDQTRVAGRDLRRAEADKVELSATGEKATRELSKLQEEAVMLRTVVQELEAQVLKLTTENQGFREEIDLKGSQYTSAQSLVGSMRDQTAEMATQLKEAKDQSESLEEELAEVQRLLNERTREGETMRRLLSDVDDKADNKVREMRERLEAAIEERDRAEDEASTNGRRRAREVEDLKNKIRDIDRDLKRAISDKEELERSEKEWKRRRDEVEKSSERATQEVADLSAAMEELRDALDTSEKQAREAEKQKIDLRRLLDDANQKYEKLQKSLKIKQQRLDELSSTPSSRSSIDGGSSTNRSNGSANGIMDYVYLKTVLLQFLEQRDKKLQTQLVPVLGKLLHFDKKDEQKWIAAISVK